MAGWEAGPDETHGMFWGQRGRARFAPPSCAKRGAHYAGAHSPAPELDGRGGALGSARSGPSALVPFGLGCL
jgi:hypothetical protein